MSLCCAPLWEALLPHLRRLLVCLALAPALSAAAAAQSCIWFEDRDGSLHASVDNETGLWGGLDDSGAWAVPPVYEDELHFWGPVEPAKFDGKYGLLRADGSWALDPVYLKMRMRVQIAAETETGWGLISQSGDWILPPEYLAIRPGAISAVQTPAGWGYVDETGAWVLEPVPMVSAGSYYGGYAVVTMEDGKSVIGPDFSISARRHQNVSMLDKDGYYIGLIDVHHEGIYGADGTEYLPPEHEQIERLRDGRFSVEDDGLIGIFEPGKGFLVPMELSKFTFDRDGQAYHRAKRGDKWGILDADYNWVIEPKYSAISRVEAGEMAVQTAEGWGIVTVDGTPVTRTNYEGIWPFVDGLAAAKWAGRWGYIDRSGRWKIAPDFLSVGYRFVGDRAMAAMAPEGGDEPLYGVIDRSGAWLIEPKYDYTEPLENGATRIGVIEPGAYEGLYGLLDAEGREIAPPVFRAISPEGSLYCVQWGKKVRFGHLDAEGRPLTFKMSDLD